MLIIASTPSGIFYRGIHGIYDPKYKETQNIIWLTPDIEYAKEYADSPDNVRQYKLKIKNSFDFGFRTLQVHVKMENMVERINARLMELFEKKKIPRSKGVKH